MISMKEYQKKIKDSFPDWDCIEDYNHLTNETNKAQFAWEFLRRNNEYQQDYYNAYHNTQNNEDFKFPLNKWGLKELSEDICPSKTKAPEFYNTRYPLVSTNKKTKLKLLKFIQAHPHKLSEINTKIKRYIKGLKSLNEPKELTLIMKFSVAWDIKSQLKTAELLLLKHKEYTDSLNTKNINTKNKKGSISNELYIRYIRIYDAINKNKMTLEEVAENLEKHIIGKDYVITDAINKLRKQSNKAKKYVNGDYRYILKLGKRKDI